MASRTSGRTATNRLHRPLVAAKTSKTVAPIFGGGFLIGGGAVSSTLSSSGVLVGGGLLTGSRQVVGV